MNHGVYGARSSPSAGCIRRRGEIIAELRRTARADLGATVRVRADSGPEALWTGPDVPPHQVGAVLDAEGYWDADHRGEIFRVEVLHALTRPRELASAEKYLVANIPHLGPKRAGLLARTLGANVLDRLIDEPDIARAIIPGGTGEAIALALRAWADEQKRDTAARVLATRLTAAGVTYGIVRRIMRFFSSADAAAVVTLRHPYRLVEVPRIGWSTADGIAQLLGVAEDDPSRFLAACHMALQEATTHGHSGLPRHRLLRAAAHLLGVPDGDPGLLRATHRLVDEGHVVEVDEILGVPERVADEAEIADRIAGINLAAQPLGSESRARIEGILQASPLSSGQRQAVLLALDHGTSVITGRPGAGKTTTLKTLVECARALGWRVQIVAPTGKAASRAAAVTGVPASTVHRLLAKEPMDAPAPLEVDLVIVDEVSMCDVPIAVWLLRAINPDIGTRVVWCGDVDQLPSVGHGQVLADLIESGVVPTAQLTEVFRHSADSPIVRNAHRLLDSEPLDLGATRGWRFVNAAGSVAHADRHVIAEVLDLFADGWARDDVQVLSPMRRGDLGVEHLNRLLQDLLNPTGSQGPWIGGGTRARRGDRVIATRNIYDLETPLYNGEQGIVVEADPRGWMRVEVGDRTVTITGIHCLMMRLAWAVTVHRSQGSEYPAVVLAYDHRAHARMLDRRLLYTAITRAKQHCSIVGTSVAISETLRGRRASSRHTTLSYHLSTLLPHVEVGTAPSSTSLPRGEAPKGASASGSPSESA